MFCGIGICRPIHEVSSGLHPAGRHFRAFGLGAGGFSVRGGRSCHHPAGRGDGGRHWTGIPSGGPDGWRSAQRHFRQRSGVDHLAHGPACGADRSRQGVDRRGRSQQSLVRARAGLPAGRIAFPCPEVQSAWRADSAGGIDGRSHQHRGAERIRQFHTAGNDRSRRRPQCLRRVGAFGDLCDDPGFHAEDSPRLFRVGRNRSGRECRAGPARTPS